MDHRGRKVCHPGRVLEHDETQFRRFPMYDNHVSQGFPHRGWRLKNSCLYDNGKQLKAFHGPIAKH
jgi:hypothetical protein